MDSVRRKLFNFNFELETLNSFIPNPQPPALSEVGFYCEKRRGVIPAKAGIQEKAAWRGATAWMPACAGMTG